MGFFLLLFLVVPFVELALLLEVGGRLGAVPTLALIFGTGFAGAWLARHQGLQVLRAIQTDLDAGRLPGDALFDGILVLVAAAFLVAPGILTDTAGLLCLAPGSRAVIKRLLARWLERRMQSGTIRFDMRFSSPHWGPTASGPVYDITPEPEATPSPGAPRVGAWTPPTPGDRQP